MKMFNCEAVVNITKYCLNNAKNVQTLWLWQALESSGIMQILSHFMLINLGCFHKLKRLSVQSNPLNTTNFIDILVEENLHKNSPSWRKSRREKRNFSPHQQSLFHQAFAYHQIEIIIRFVRLKEANGEPTQTFKRQIYTTNKCVDERESPCTITRSTLYCHAWR